MIEVLAVLEWDIADMNSLLQCGTYQMRTITVEMSPGDIVQENDVGNAPKIRFAGVLQEILQDMMTAERFIPMDRGLREAGVRVHPPGKFQDLQRSSEVCRPLSPLNHQPKYPSRQS